MLTTLDYVLLVAYLIGVAAFGLVAGGRQTSASDYFLGGRDLPWWAICLSVVATETSTLTVIGVPAIAYLGTMTFLQIAIGYLLGRIVVSVYFLPKYFAGELNTAYAYLGARFGDRLRGTASVTFLLTRLLADGVRLFATAIPLKVIADMAGFAVTYPQIIVAIGIVTALYTLVGGLRAVVWMDAVQMVLYTGGALLAVVLLAGAVPEGWWGQAVEAGKHRVFDWSPRPVDWLTQPYSLVTAVLGGAIFSMASHGTDQLIVQRLLACRSLRDSQKALVGSGVLVFIQLALFLVVGLLLWGYYEGASMEALGLARGDEIFPRYIIEGMPPGISGLLLAGIVAAAMSTLSSSINALASSSVNDLYERFTGRAMSPARGLRVSRILTLFWSAVLIGFASLFQDQQNPVVELGLAIAGFTYGGLLGAFLLGLFTDRSSFADEAPSVGRVPVETTRKRVTETDAVVAFLCTIAFMTFIIFSVWYDPGSGDWKLQLDGWQRVLFPADAPTSFANLQQLAWPWYPAFGTGVSLLVGSLLSLRHR